MKHGERIPKDKRDDMARMAAAIASSMPLARANEALVGMYGVCATTARRLIRRGRFLTAGDVAPPVQPFKGRAEG